MTSRSGPQPAPSSAGGEARIAALEGALNRVLDRLPQIKEHPQNIGWIEGHLRQALAASALSLISASLQEQGEQEGWWVKPEWHDFAGPLRGSLLWLYGNILVGRVDEHRDEQRVGKWRAIRSGQVVAENLPTLEAAKAALIEAVRPKPPAPPVEGGE